MSVFNGLVQSKGGREQQPSADRVGGGIPAGSDGEHKPDKRKDSFLVGMSMTEPEL